MSYKNNIIPSDFSLESKGITKQKGHPPGSLFGMIQ